MQRRRLALIAAASLFGRHAASQTAPALRISGPPSENVQGAVEAAVAQRLLNEIYRQSDLGIEIIALPAARSNLDVKSGRIDGELMRTRAYGLRNPDLLRVEPAYYRAAVHAFSLKTRQLQIQGREDLARYSIGALRGVSYVPALVAGHEAVTLAGTSEQLMRMLEVGRIDMVWNGRLSGRLALARLGLTGAVSISPELERFELFHYLRPDKSAAAVRLSATIQRMRASGELERLTQEYETAVLAQTTPPLSSQP